MIDLDREHYFNDQQYVTEACKIGLTQNSKKLETVNDDLAEA